VTTGDGGGLIVLQLLCLVLASIVSYIDIFYKMKSSLVTSYAYEDYILQE